MTPEKLEAASDAGKMQGYGMSGDECMPELPLRRPDSAADDVILSRRPCLRGPRFAPERVLTASSGTGAPA